MLFFILALIFIIFMVFIYKLVCAGKRADKGEEEILKIISSESQEPSTDMEESDSKVVLIN